jgi:serine/threonine protein phosphatase PrpC
MVERFSTVKASAGFASDTGPRERNEDFGGVVFGPELPQPRRDIVAAIADGIGGAKGGRIAAETAVRGFLDGFCDMPETMEVRRASAIVLNSLNRWIYSEGHRNAESAGMGCTFTAMVLRGRIAHVLHVGDSRAYRLRGERLALLTTDHVREERGGGRSNILSRALGVETEVRLDYAAHPVALHDRFLLCTDGVHGYLKPEVIADILRERSGSEDSANALVKAALDAGSTDNCTALVLDVVDLPTGSADISAELMELPLIPVPIDGETVDGFVLKVLMSDGRYTRLFGAADEVEGGEVALKFPKPQVAAVATYRAAFIREAWVGARVHSPWVGRTIELPPGRRTALYTVMPLYQGELLETRLGRRPGLGLEEGRNIAIKLARGVAALHRAGIIHRDIKPDNVILEREGSLKLIDLGVVRVPGLEDFPPDDIPGTPAYMAPEMFAGEPGNELTDIFALGVTMFRAFTGEFPYGNIDATSRPRRDRPKALADLRPDLPAWLQTALARAIAADPANRFKDMMEFAVEMEEGPARAPHTGGGSRTFYQRYPVLVWQAISGLLAAALAVSVLLRH